MSSLYEVTGRLGFWIGLALEWRRFLLKLVVFYKLGLDTLKVFSYLEIKCNGKKFFYVDLTVIAILWILIEDFDVEANRNILFHQHCRDIFDYSTYYLNQMVCCLFLRGRVVFNSIQSSWKSRNGAKIQNLQGEMQTMSKQLWRN